MTSLRSDRLLKLADHLESGNLGHQIFDIRTWNENLGLQLPPGPTCGTTGCAIGECPIAFPDDWEFNDRGTPVLKVNPTGHIHHDIMQFFEIPLRAGLFLFTSAGPAIYSVHPNGAHDNARYIRGPLDVARELRATVAANDVIAGILQAWPQYAEKWASWAQKTRSKDPNLEKDLP